MGEINLHVPVDISSVPPEPLAARPGTLRGLRVGLLDNGKEFSDIVLEGLGDTLAGCDVVYWRKGFPSKMAPFIAEMAADVDVAVCGVGH